MTNIFGKSSALILALAVTAALMTAPLKAKAEPAPQETGQSAFAALAEITALLLADPATDWTRVNMAALQSHLRDMYLVTLFSEVEMHQKGEEIEMILSGSADTKEAIWRITAAHAPFLEMETGWQVHVARHDETVQMTVTAPQKDHPKIRALGYHGLLTLGAHHQEHHLMMAQGNDMAHHGH